MEKETEMSMFWPYRWKSVLIVFKDEPLDESVLSEHNRLAFIGRVFGDKTVISAGSYKKFGKKAADNLALKMRDGDGNITIEPCEQVFFSEYVLGRDKKAIYLTWLYKNFGDVTLDEDTDATAAAEDEQEQVSVTRVCEICGKDISDKRAGTKTCSPAHRKALSRIK